MLHRAVRPRPLKIDSRRKNIELQGSWFTQSRRATEETWDQETQFSKSLRLGVAGWQFVIIACNQQWNGWLVLENPQAVR